MPAVDDKRHQLVNAHRNVQIVGIFLGSNVPDLRHVVNVRVTSKRDQYPPQRDTRSQGLHEAAPGLQPCSGASRIRYCRERVGKLRGCNVGYVVVGPTDLGGIGQRKIPPSSH
jgi:hypothetical protein